MSKRKQQLLEEAKNLKEQAKRLRKEADSLQYYEQLIELLDRDLNSWKEHLAKNTSKQGAWKLMFWSQDYTGNLQMAMHGYAPSVHSENNWSFEDYMSSKQNLGPLAVAFADDPQLLFHPNRHSRIRLEAVKFVYLVCPAKLDVRKESRAEVSGEVSLYVRGLLSKWHPQNFKETPREIYELLISDAFLEDWDRKTQKFKNDDLEHMLKDQRNNITNAQKSVELAKHEFKLLQPKQ